MITPCDPLSIDVDKSDVTRSSLFQSLGFNSGKSLDDLSQLFIFRMRPHGLIKLIDYFYVCVAAWRESGMMMMMNWSESKESLGVSRKTNHNNE